MPASDAEVVLASIKDPAVFGEIFDRHAAVILRFLARRVGPEAAEGLLGETFRIAFERRESFDSARANAGPWLYGIAGKVLLHHRRTEARRLRATARLLARREAARAPDDEVDKVVAAADAAALWPRIVEAITVGLPDGEREVLLLFAWEDLSYEEIAAALDLPAGTVRSRLNRARTRLRELAGASGKEARTSNSQDGGRCRP